MRTVKPEFWDDEVIGSLSRDARLLFIATWNAADDEGLLRWNAAYLKAQAFMYDDDIGLESVERLMGEIVQNELIFPYRGGKTQQRLGVVVKFHKHQRINRPQPSKLPAPSLQSTPVAEMYGRRDEWTCHICGEEIAWPGKPGHPRDLELDHVQPRSKGGTDYPSNIRASHGSCNASKKDKVRGRPNDSLNDSVNDSLNDSSTCDERLTDGVVKGKGVVGEKVEEEAAPPSPGAAPRSPGTAIERPEIERLCTRLADHIEANGSKRPAIGKKWLDAARLMLDVDGRTEADITAAIDWCQGHEFWRANILSFPKLREKYDQLRLQAGRESPRSGSVVPIDRRQQAINDRYDRALERARALDALEAHGEP